MIKQRKDSIAQFEAGGRQDLVDIEKAELEILAVYMPAALSESEVKIEVDAAVAAAGAAGPQDMGKVMAILNPKLAGRADMTAVSGRSEEHTSELQSLMRNPYAVICLKTKTNTNRNTHK